jgi:membrane protease YdiL (CAAX protease family)
VDIFFNARHELRAPWKLLFFLVMLVLAYVAVGVVASLLGTGTAAGLIALKALELMAVAAATAVALRVTEQRAFAEVGFALAPGWWREVTFGTAYGTALIGGALLPAAVLGSLSLAPGSPDLSLAVALVFFLVAAAYEELLCRGFALQTLARGIGRAPAALLMSGIFAWLHAQNPHVTPAALATTFAAGLLLSLAYFRTESLWLATGLHFGWNFALGYVFGLPVSGLRFFPEAPIMVGAGGEPVWLTGGDYGPEGGVAALAAVVIGCVVLLRLPVPNAAARVTPEA